MKLVKITYDVVNFCLFLYLLMAVLDSYFAYEYGTKVRQLEPGEGSYPSFYICHERTRRKLTDKLVIIGESVKYTINDDLKFERKFSKYLFATCNYYEPKVDLSNRSQSVLSFNKYLDYIAGSFSGPYGQLLIRQLNIAKYNYTVISKQLLKYPFGIFI